MMVDKLYTIIPPRDAEHDPKTLSLKYARQPDTATAFNCASMAFNNHFFFERLSPKSTNITDKLRPYLTRNFSSVETLRKTFIATANAMFGPGFVWLVQSSDHKEHLYLLTTYLAGSPLAGAHHRRQPVDTNTQDAASWRMMGRDAGATATAYAEVTHQKKGPTGWTQHQAVVAPGGIILNPLLCLNTWEHVWLMDYGIAGKQTYVEAWWDRIDWAVVQNTFLKPPVGQGGVGAGGRGGGTGILGGEYAGGIY
ncbi:MAG: hypothetical protein M1816_002969 [Peltula sp. TS41687]|nr:MAG: hypothetical protein M1816_002969 [Peltula sp. TS41687]